MFRVFFLKTKKANMAALVPGRKSHNPVASISNIQEIVSGLKAEGGRMPIDQPVRMLVLEELN